MVLYFHLFHSQHTSGPAGILPVPHKEITQKNSDINDILTIEKQ